MQDEWVSSTRGRIHAHVLPTRKYKMVSVLAQWESRLARGLATRHALLPQVLQRGTARHATPEAIVRSFEALYGANLSGRVNKHGDIQTVEFGLHIPAPRYLDGDEGVIRNAMSLFAEVLFDPKRSGEAFLGKDVETEKRLLSQRIENLFNDKIAYAMQRCVQIMCEKEPFGVPRLGFAEDVPGVDATGLFQAHRDLTEGQPLNVYAVGAVDPDRFVETLFDAFGTRSGSLNRSGPPEEKPNGAPSLATESVDSPARVRTIVEEADVNQGKLNIGLRAGLDFRSEDYLALVVYNGILGGFSHSKLFQQVREKSSLAYYASSRLEGLKGLLFIQSGIAVESYDRALEIIDRQLDAMRNGEITEEELSFTKKAITNQYLQSDDQPLTGAVLHMYGRYTGRVRSLEEMIRGVESVGREDVIRAAQNIRMDTVYFLRDKERAHAKG